MYCLIFDAETFVEASSGPGVELHPVVNSSSSSGAARLVCCVLNFGIIDCAICLYINYSWSFWRCSGLCTGKNAAAICIGRSCELRHRTHPSSRQRGCAGPTPNSTCNCTASTDCRSTCTALGIDYGWACLLRWHQLSRAKQVNACIGHCGKRPVISILFPQKWRRLKRNKPPLAARHGSRRDPYARGMCPCDAEQW